MYDAQTTGDLKTLDESHTIVIICHTFGNSKFTWINIINKWIYTVSEIG